MKTKTARCPVSDVLFVLILFLVFTGCALTIVLLGARVYESTAVRLEDNYTARTAMAYVSEKLRHFDVKDSITLQEADGISVLVLSEEIEGIPYHTRLYFKDGMLCELFTKASSPVSFDGGTPLVELKNFTMKETDAGFYEFTAVSLNEETLHLFIQPQSR